MNTLNKLVKNDLVIWLPKLKFDKNKICDACQFDKKVKSSFKAKNLVSTSRSLELLHIDLFGLMDVISMGGKSYRFFIVDDYSRFIWYIFLCIKMKHCMCLLSIVTKYKMKNVLLLWMLEVIMVVNLTTMVLKCFAIKMVLVIIFCS